VDQVRQNLKSKMKIQIISALLMAASISARAASYPEVTINGVSGFQDTPMQPDGKWHVHDPARPQPPVVATGEFSENAPPPSDELETKIAPAIHADRRIFEF
jgi:hypothetical protein